MTLKLSTEELDHLYDLINKLYISEDDKEMIKLLQEISMHSGHLYWKAASK